jgi:hypothetical protein
VRAIYCGLFHRPPLVRDKSDSGPRGVRHLDRQACGETNRFTPMNRLPSVYLKPTLRASGRKVPPNLRRIIALAWPRRLALSRVASRIAARGVLLWDAPAGLEMRRPSGQHLGGVPPPNFRSRLGAAMRKKRTAKAKSKPPKRIRPGSSARWPSSRPRSKSCRRNGRKNCCGNSRSGIDRRVLKKYSLFLRHGLVTGCAVCATKARACGKWPKVAGCRSPAQREF